MTKTRSGMSLAAPGDARSGRRRVFGPGRGRGGHVVVVESPAKAKTIGRYLGDDYRVLASYGHVIDLPAREGHRLLPARHLEEHGPAVRAGTDAAGHRGEVFHLANGRCPSADRARAASDVAAPHPAHTRPPIAAASTQAAIARTTAAAHLGVAPHQDTSQTAPCSADLWRLSTNNQSFTTVLALSCGSRVSTGPPNPGPKRPGRRGPGPE